jgi:DNA-binding transcriptional MerR regulator
MYYKIKEIADMSGVSVRMLHYYDKIGLLKPENVSQAGYRLYTTDDIKKLSQILFYKELDFSLEEIKEILDSSNADQLEVLKMQQQILTKKREKIDALMGAINKSIISLEQGENPKGLNIFTSLDLVEISRNKDQLKKDLMVHLFPQVDEECGTKTSGYSKDDWTIIMSKMEGILNEIAIRMDKRPETPEIQELIGEFKEFINHNLIRCNNDLLKLLGALYVDNPLYRNYMEQYGENFPEFLKSAIDFYVGD